MARPGDNVQTKEDSACGGIPQAAGEVPTHEGRGCAVALDMGVPEMEGPLWGGPGRGGLPNGHMDEELAHDGDSLYGV